MTSKRLIVWLLVLLLCPAGSFGAEPGTGSTSDAEAQRKAEEEARRRYIAMIMGLCQNMDGSIGTAEQQKQVIISVARSMGTEDGSVRGAWDALLVVTDSLEGAGASNAQAKALVQPEANLNNAQVLVQDSRKNMASVAEMLAMNTERLFGFKPPPDWNGVLPGEKPSPGWNPNGTVPHPSAPGSNPGSETPFAPFKPPVTNQVPANPGATTPPAGGSAPGVTKMDGATAGAGAGAGTAGESGVVPLLKTGPGPAAHPSVPSAASYNQMGGGSAEAGSSGGLFSPRRSGSGGEEVYENPLRAGGGPSGDPSSTLGVRSKAAAEAWKLNLGGRYDEAERAAMEAIRRNARDHEAYEALAWSQLRLGRYKDSERSASRAIAINGRSARAYRIRAYARQMLGDRAGMIADIEMAAKLDPVYEEEAALARRGLDIYDPSKGDEQLLNPRRRTAAPRTGLGWLLLLLGAFAAGGVALFLRKPRTQKAKTVRTVGAVPGLSPGPALPLAGIPSALSGYELGKALGRAAVVRRMTLSDPGERARFLASARKAARFSHPAAVRIYEIAEEGEKVSIVCEHVAGSTLRELLDRERWGGAERIVRLLTPVCQVLEAAHAAGLAHGRIHLGNVFVSDSGEVKVADFGTAGPGAGAAQDIAALGRCLAELAEPGGMSAPDGLKSLVERAAGKAGPPFSGAGEFLKALAGAIGRG